MPTANDFGPQYFERYCKGKSYLDSIPNHLFKYKNLVGAYASAFASIQRSQDKSTYTLRDFFEMTNEWLAKQRVLDAGCAMGHFIADLQANGVEAFGYDISQYAIDHCIPTIADCVQVGDHDSTLPTFKDQEFDLIFATSWQYTHDIKQLWTWLKNAYRVCRHSMVSCGVTADTPDRVITENITDIQLVKPQSWWSQQYLGAGFQRLEWVDDCICICFKGK